MTQGRYDARERKEGRKELQLQGWYYCALKQSTADLVNENDISHIIYQCALEVHRTLGGPGLLESVYEEALVAELSDKAMCVGRQVAVPIRYKTKILATPLRLDMLVGEKVVVECKSVVEYNPIFEAQALTYLRLTGLRLALVINFGEQYVTKGIHRVVNNLET